MRAKTPKTLVPSKVKRRRFIAFFRKLFWVVIVITIIVQLYRVNALLNNSATVQFDKSMAQIESLNDEINQLREYLLLPIKDTSEETDSGNANPFESDFGQILKEYKQEKAQQQQASELIKVLNSNIVKTVPENFELVSPNQHSYFITADNKQLLEFGLNNTKLYIITPYSKNEYTIQTTAKYIERINKLQTAEQLGILLKVYNRVALAKSLMSNIQNDYSTFAKLLEEKKLVAMELVANDSSAIVQFKTLDGNNAGSIQYSYPTGEYFALGQNNHEISPRSKDLGAIISNLETYFALNSFETLLQKNIKEKVATITRYIESSNFKELINSSNLTYEVKDSEATIDFIFTDKATKEVAFLIYIDKLDASVYFKKGETLRKLAFNNTEFEANNTNKTFLIAGKHGSLTDTIILANINEQDSSVKLLSIPRDLYVDGQKINSVYAKEGMPALEAKLEQVTGLAIESYALIDMYAFVDVVDYMGGLTVYLENDIIDPTYKTFDNGIWGTMYFAAGEHHVNGKQALRLARSRHTSSDFDRAKRQHIILSAASQRLKELGLKDTTALVQIAYTVLSKTETNFSRTKAITYYFKYKDFDIKGQNVLSTGNVLVSTYSNEYLSNNCTNCGKGAYILVPKNNDWSLIKTYVASVLSS